MGLDVADFARRYACLTQRRFNDLLLRGWIRDGVPVGLAAVIQGGSAKDAVDMVAVGLGLGERLQQNASDAFAGDVSVATFAEALASSLARNELSLAEKKILVRMQREVHAAGESHLDVAAEQALASQVNGGERRRAHRIDSNARAAEVEEVGDAIGHAGGAAGERDGASVSLLFSPVKLIFGVHDADVDADGPARVEVARVACILQRLPCGFEEQALLRVDDGGFERRNPEEAGVEFVDVVQESAPLAADFAFAILLRIVIEVMIPAVAGNLSNAVDSGAEITPERRDVRRFRIAAAKADDGDFERAGAVRGGGPRRGETVRLCRFHRDGCGGDRPCRRGAGGENRL